MADDNKIGIQVGIQTGGSEKQLEKVTDELGKVEKAAKKAAPTISNLNTSFKDVAGGFTGLFIARPAVHALLGLVTAGDQLNVSLSNLGKVTTLSAEQSKAMGSAMLHASNSTGISLKHISDTARDLVAGGLAPADLAADNFLTTLAKFQTLSTLTSKQVADMTVAVDMFGIKAGAGMTNALDKISAVADATKLGPAGFTEILTKVGPVAKVAEQSLDDVLVTVGALSRGFKSGTDAGTQMSLLMNKLGPSTAKAKELYREFGIQTAGLNGRMRPLSEILHEIAQRVKPNEMGKLGEIFGERTGERTLTNAVATLHDLNGEMKVSGNVVRGGMEILQAFRKELGMASGAIEQKFSNSIQNLTAQLTIFLNIFDNILGSLGGPLTQSLSTLLKHFADLGTWISTALHENEKFAAGVGWVAVALGTAALVIAGMIGGFALLNISGVVLKMTLRNIGALWVMLPAWGQRVTGTLFGMKLAADLATSSAFRLRTALLALTWLGGPLGIILTLVSFLLPALLDKFNVAGSSQLKKQKEEILDQHMKIVEKQLNTVIHYGRISDKLLEITNKFEGMIIKKFPILKTQSYDAVVKTIPYLQQAAPDLPKGTIEGLVQTVHTWMTAQQQNKATPELTHMGVVAMQQLKGYAAQAESLGLGGGVVKKGQQGLVDMLTNLHESLSEANLIFTNRHGSLRAGGNIYKAPIDEPNALGTVPGPYYGGHRMPKTIAGIPASIAGRKDAFYDNVKMTYVTVQELRVEKMAKDKAEADAEANKPSFFHQEYDSTSMMGS